MARSSENSRIRAKWKKEKEDKIKEKKELVKAKKEISSDLDKRGTGIIDEIEDLPNDEFKKLLNKY